ncbi:hypothetical protein [Actinacidiphila sp. ITFR-21]|uniref:hypothetical protein n=1 Tax=Actinacidiphila sp. ITFR-21 TaxID=3075199 RepID=UPI002889261E|nr:hypothetical protein [Streptomyces sp. ITFR-21]WNI20216.1 hypothetical protein RLT57_32240 [Streptomyces sp. ITFR-21]
MRRNPRIDHLARLVDNLLDGLAAHGRPAPTAPQIRAALRELQHGGRRGRRARRRPGARR